MLNILQKRWRAVKRMRANLLLVAAGIALILVAPIWRFAVAPALKVVATDMEQVLQYEGVLTYFVNPPDRQVPGAPPSRASVGITKTVRSEPLVSTAQTAVFKAETSIYDSASGQLISEGEHTYAVDRRTGEQVKSDLADRERSGYFIVFPFNTPRSSVPLWSELAGATFPAEFEGKTFAGGLATYRFSMSFADRPAAATPRGYPETIQGAPLKEWLEMSDVAVDDDVEVKPEYRCSQDTLLKVEPRMGTIVETSSGRDTVTLAVEDAGGNLLLSRALYTLEYKQTRESVKTMSAFAREEVSKLKLQFVYIPLGLLVLGLAVLMVGAFAGVKPAREAE